MTVRVGSTGASRPGRSTDAMIPCGADPTFAECPFEDAAQAAERELKENVKPFLDEHPWLVARRVGRIVLSAASVAAAWLVRSPKRGAVLRDAVADLGPVFVKLGRDICISVLFHQWCRFTRPSPRSPCRQRRFTDERHGRLPSPPADLPSFQLRR